MDEIRAKRAAALEEKRKKLEELKARRSTRSVTAASSTSTGTSKSGNLDDYIDDLLNSTAPPPSSSSSAAAVDNSIKDAVQEADIPPKTSSPVQMNDSDELVSVPVPTKVEQPPVMKKKTVETFTIAIQTEADDFPENVDEDTNDKVDADEKEATVKEMDEPVVPKETNAPVKEPSLLPEEQMDEAVSTESFTSFFNSASKKVERLLGAPILSDLMVGDKEYYTDKESKRDTSSVRGKEGSFVSAQVSFSFPKWTQNRDITSIDWSPHHRGELMLASYNIPTTSKSTMGETAISTMKPHESHSASLFPRSKTEMTNADGLCIVWNLSMPSRPEHIFTCGSPVLNAKFHPTEGSLVVGACYSGQVVIWDVRNGRLPVQKSSLNSLGKDGIGAHVYPVVGMETLDSGFVTASVDGTVNFWSPSNLMEPVEKMVVPGVNISSIAVAPASQSILVGGENGSIHALIPSASTSGRSSSSKRAIVKLHEGHYGNITGLSTKRLLKQGSNATMSRGFLRGAEGLVLSCGVDWTTRLWAPAYSDKPLLEFLSHSYDYMSDVQWNPVHPSTFATASSNGRVGLWNLASSLEEPITGLQGITVEDIDTDTSKPRGINRLRWSLDGRRLAVACSDTLHVLGMNEDVWKPKGGEANKLMSNLQNRGLLEEVEE